MFYRNTINHKLIICVVAVSLLVTGYTVPAGASDILDIVNNAATMGRAGAGASGGDRSYLVNPAIISWESFKYYTEATNWQTEWGVKNNMLSFNRKADNAVVGVDVAYVAYGQQEKTNTVGNVVGTVNSNDMVFGVRYSNKFLPILSAGVCLKYLSRNLDTYHGSGIAVDIGLKAMPADPIELGIVWNNMPLRKVTLNNHDDHFPTRIILGSRWRFWREGGMSLYFINDISYSFFQKYNQNYVSALEWEFKNTITMRAGRSDKDKDGFKGGVGFTYREIYMDYALSNGEAGLKHILSISTRFGKSLNEE